MLRYLGLVHSLLLLLVVALATRLLVTSRCLRGSLVATIVTVWHLTSLLVAISVRALACYTLDLLAHDTQWLLVQTCSLVLRVCLVLLSLSGTSAHWDRGHPALLPS